MRTFPLVILASLALAACGQKSAQTDGAAAPGEVLPGSVSDAMLDTTRSQAEAPLMAVKAEGAKAAAKPTDDASAGASEGDAPAPAPSASTTEAAKVTNAAKPTSPKPASTN